MNFRKEKVKDFYLLDTKVENIFINEYMPQAPADFVKVYIYASMYAEHGLILSQEQMSKQLKLTEEKIKEAWNYWEKVGAIKKRYMETTDQMDFTVEFINLKELLYGKNQSLPQATKEKKKEDNVFGNNAVKEMFTEIEKLLGRGLSSSEVNEFLMLLTDYNATPEVVLYGMKYCLEKNKNSIRYIEKVIISWCDQGLDTVDQVNEKLQEMDERYYRYKRVMNALGFTRNASEVERSLMDNWFDNLGFSMDRVLDACRETAGIPNPNFKYVNKVLENWSNNAEKNDRDVNKVVTVTQAILNQYYDYLREKAGNEAESRRIEIYNKIPRIEEIDEEMGKVSSQLSKALILGSSKSEGKIIKDKMDKLAAERAVILTENNFEMDYTDIKYACDKCNDTGITDLGERCSCIKQRMEEAEVWQKKKNIKK